VATKLDKQLKREIDVNGVAFMVTLTPEGLKVVQKGRRNGPELTWEQIVRGDVTLTQDLKDSVDISAQ
jgi:hypothetical protein